VSGTLPIAKMSGAGNDFVVVDAPTWEAIPGDREAWVRAVCRRGVSVGADGVLVVGAGEAGRVKVTFFNPDGGEAFCGNGSRCAARYAVVKGIAPGPAVVLATPVGDVPAELDGDTVTLTLPPPQDRGAVDLPDGSGTVRGRFVLAGVPHVVIPVVGLDAYPLVASARAWRRHQAFGPDGANVNVVEEDAAGRIRVRTFERGVEGETLACGTGAVAAAFAARIAGASDPVTIVPASGISLRVELPGDAQRPALARLSGDARFVFEGLLAREGLTGAA
jgi:diaminopimelate epimerase